MTVELREFLGLLIPLLGVFTGLAVAQLSRSQARESRTIADLRADVVLHKTESDEAAVQARLWADYAHLLRRQYTEATGKPPPPFPEGLTTI